MPFPLTNQRASSSDQLACLFQRAVSNDELACLFQRTFFYDQSVRLFFRPIHRRAFSHRPISVLGQDNVVGREYAYVNATMRNRRAFVRAVHEVGPQANVNIPCTKIC